ncbi:MAG TPA: glycosyltransferase family 2 protein, partial [Candidatus Saccharimonadales bacterium]|nr:glycosyltransferase family 2 protein [Candidatus Saccharimonadales bacterium]
MTDGGIAGRLGTPRDAGSAPLARLRLAARAGARMLACVAATRRLGLARHFLGLYAVMRDEAHIIREWMATHVREGVEHFYLVDHGCRDDWRGEVEDFIARGMVTVLRPKEATADQARAANCVLPLRE